MVKQNIFIDGNFPEKVGKTVKKYRKIVNKNKKENTKTCSLSMKYFHLPRRDESASFP